MTLQTICSSHEAVLESTLIMITQCNY